MSKTAFLYPGQGAQKTGMGADFYEHSTASAEIFEMSARILGIDMKALCFEENDRLDLTEYTQAALVTTCLAMTREVLAHGIVPDVTAGLSLGEYAAIAAAGGMKEPDAIRLVRKRGILMQSTIPAGEGAMCAIFSMDAEKIEEVIAGIAGVWVANYNCPGQIVITGKKTAVGQAAERLKNAGAKRTVMLNVSGPFHSPMLIPAGEELRKALDETEFSKLQIPYVTNVTAEIIKDISQTKDLLEKQVSMPVRWMQSIETMVAEGVDTFIEIGPGKTLSAFMKKINRNLNVYNIATWEDLERTAVLLGKGK